MWIGFTRRRSGKTRKDAVLIDLNCFEHFHSARNKPIPPCRCVKPFTTFDKNYPPSKQYSLPEQEED